MKQTSQISHLVDQIISQYLYLQEQDPDNEPDEIRRDELGWHIHSVYEDMVEKIRILHSMNTGNLPERFNEYGELKFIFNNI